MEDAHGKEPRQAGMLNGREIPRLLFRTTVRLELPTLSWVKKRNSLRR
ncbi:hypothetical protein V22_04190 [Calycomorphotria hydatis]|uniref:Uncharacterized protein n=1 Tax=Calycomorphotria hydatis TaxID=2528027 RepID=A0A517T4C0_9PLAN|nr:hypothetical protein V22_04190 [Calycomorphotria hydatis]